MCLSRNPGHGLWWRRGDALPTFKIVLAYDGTDFVGWQRQASGVSIQGLLEDALRELDERDVPVAGAGRTDAGVHALGQTASFSLNRAIAGDTLVRAFNARLPHAVRVLSGEEMPPAFHARFDARRKVYRYCIWNGDVLPPFDRWYAWHVPGTLDVGAMQAAAAASRGPSRLRGVSVRGQSDEDDRARDLLIADSLIAIRDSL